MVLLPSASRSAARHAYALLRHSSSSPPAVSLQLVAELRKRTTATIQKAREALIASNSDVSAALEWLERDRISTGQRKAEKVGGRFAGEGLVGVSVLSQGTGDRGDGLLGVRAAMVELNCETDFVGRNELFRALTQDLAFTAAFISDPQPSPGDNTTNPFLRSIDLSHLRNAPLMVRDQDSPTKTVAEAIRDIISAVGENISIRRAVSFTHNPIPLASGVGLRVSSYVHGAISTPPEKASSSVTEAQGKIGALVAVGLRTSPASRLRELVQHSGFNADISTLERALARQVVGMRPQSLRGDTEDALYNQSFGMLMTSDGQTVEAVLDSWSEKQNMTGNCSKTVEETGLSVVEFLRWEVGQGLL